MFKRFIIHNNDNLYRDIIDYKFFENLPYSLIISYNNF